MRTAFTIICLLGLAASSRCDLVGFPVSRECVGRACTEQVPCVSIEATHPGFQHIEGFSHPPPSLDELAQFLDAETLKMLRRIDRPCWNTDLQCFRAVVDNVIPRTLARDLYDKYKDEQTVTFMHDDIKTHDDLHQVDTDIRKTFATVFGIDNLHINSLAIAVAWPDRAANWTGLHADGESQAENLYTAVLFLTEDGVDHVDGQFGIADKANVIGEPDPDLGPAQELEMEAVDGWVVSAVPGRAAFFSAGKENMHNRLPVTKGRRMSINVWYSCEGELAAQRAAVDHDTYAHHDEL